MPARKLDEYEKDFNAYLNDKDKARLDEVLENIKNKTSVLYSQEEFKQRMDTFFEELKNRA